MNQIYMTNGTGKPRYWFQGVARCEYCDQILEIMAYNVWVWRRDGTYTEIFSCPKCVAKIPSSSPFAPIQERRQIIITETIPPGARPVIPRRPDLATGSISVFDAASHQNAPSEKVKDETKFSGRSNSTFLDDSAPVFVGADVHKLLESKDSELSVNNGLKKIEQLGKEARK